MISKSNEDLLNLKKSVNRSSNNYLKNNITQKSKQTVKSKESLSSNKDSIPSVTSNKTSATSKFKNTTREAKTVTDKQKIVKNVEKDTKPKSGAPSKIANLAPSQNVNKTGKLNGGGGPTKKSIFGKHTDKEENLNKERKLPDISKVKSLILLRGFVAVTVTNSIKTVFFRFSAEPGTGSGLFLALNYLETKRKIQYDLQPIRFSRFVSFYTHTRTYIRLF